MQLTNKPMSWPLLNDFKQPKNTSQPPRVDSRAVTAQNADRVIIVGAVFMSSLTWSMALPDTGVKCATHSLPGSATSATCSSAAMSPPRPVLVWSCRPSKYSALSSPPLCCGSPVAAVMCLSRHRSLQTFFGSTTSCVLSCKTRPMSIWKTLMTAATVDKPDPPAASPVLVKSSLFDSRAQSVDVLAENCTHIGGTSSILICARTSLIFLLSMPETGSPAAPVRLLIVYAPNIIIRAPLWFRETRIAIPAHGSIAGSGSFADLCSGTGRCQIACRISSERTRLVLDSLFLFLVLVNRRNRSYACFILRTTLCA